MHSKKRKIQYRGRRQGSRRARLNWLNQIDAAREKMGGVGGNEEGKMQRESCQQVLRLAVRRRHLARASLAAKD